MVKKDFELTNKLGLHSRAAALFVQLTNKYLSDINITKENKTIDGKSIMGILSLGVSKGDTITISAEGVDEGEVIQKIETLLTEELNNV